MAQQQISEQDARALAEKMVAFAESLGPGERRAFEALERHIGMLVATDDIMQETQQGESDSRREALWYQLATGLSPS
jgi:hypothetical protein